MEILERKGCFLQLISGHVLISFGALAITTLVGISLGIWVFYSTKSKTFVLPLINFLYTIPSIAMFGLLIPLVDIGLKNALIVLVLYGLLPMVRNTYTGLCEVRPDIVEAAKAMGAYGKDNIIGLARTPEKVNVAILHAKSWQQLMLV
jgi:osmoprotectant transport system permease protein